MSKKKSKKSKKSKKDVGKRGDAPEAKPAKFEEQAACDEELRRRLEVFDPVFVVNEAPEGRHLNLAREHGVPVVVLLTSDFKEEMFERRSWVRANVPSLPDVVLENCGHASMIPAVKQAWRERVRSVCETAQGDGPASGDDLPF